MSNPIIKSIPAFDANKGAYLEFSVPNASTQIYGSSITISNNTTNDLIYTETTDGTNKPYASMLYTHPLTKEMGLENGKVYNVSVTVYDNGFKNVIGTSTTKQLFRCYTQPYFALSVTDGQTINSSNISVKIIYSQYDQGVEPEDLYECVLYLYSASKTVIYQTDTIYDTSNKDDNNGIVKEIELSGLSENTYYLQAKGVTEFGTELDTGLIEFSIAYNTPAPTIILEATNEAEEAAIKIRSNIHAILYDVGNPKIDYIDGLSADLRNNWINYNRGYLLDDNYCALIKVRDCNDDTTIMTLFSSSHYQTGLLEFKTLDTYGVDTVAINDMTYIDEKGNICTRLKGDHYIDWDAINKREAYFRFSVTTDTNCYTLQTDFFPYPNENEWFYVGVYRVDDLYGLFAIKNDGMVII